MKKLYILCIALLFNLLCFSQARFFLIGGAHGASVKETNSIPGWDSTTKPNYKGRTGMNIGLLADLSLSESGNWYFQPGILFMGKGRKYAQVNDTSVATLNDTLIYNNNLVINYIEIPLNFTYKIAIGKKSNFIVGAGPYLSFYLSGKSTTEIREYSTNKFTKEETPLQVGNATNKAKTFDFGVNARAGFELGNVLITGFFSQGLTSFYTASYEGDFKHRVIGASVGFGLYKTPAKPKDKDLDGILDEQDACPTIAGTAATNGCPDRDYDGVADNVDKCADQAGLAKYNGCPIPDTDKDGVNDEEDKCPSEAGSQKHNGCPVPDSDGDGMNDESDSCPDKAGIVEFNGCPIPDSDGDGLNDKEDKCPTETGTLANNGCPEVKKDYTEKVNFAARNIFYDLNSDKILAKSFDALKEVAIILKENPTLKLSIEGHTDNVGKAAQNLSLSQKRANAVKKYLVSQGIDNDRLTAVGYGQEKPIADNKTAEGQSKNRRVELKLSQD